MNSIFQEFKNNFKSGSMTVRLIYINATVFCIIGVGLMIVRFSNPSTSLIVQNTLDNIFNLQTNWKSFLTHPWGVITYMFSHYAIFHLLFNMLMLFGIGRLYEHYLGGKRLVYTYVLGGLAGGLLEVIGQNIGVVKYGSVVGASGAVMAIIFATAAYIPKFKISVWGLFDLNLRTLAIILLLFNILSIGADNGTAVLAHLGGALIGHLSVKNLNSRTNIINTVMRWTMAFSKLFEKKPKIKKSYSNPSPSSRPVSDEDYNTAKKQKQDRINVILEKISKSGYESLTKQEKEFLFQQSNNV